MFTYTQISPIRECPWDRWPFCLQPCPLLPTPLPTPLSAPKLVHLHPSWPRLGLFEYYQAFSALYYVANMNANLLQVDSRLLQSALCPYGGSWPGLAPGVDALLTGNCIALLE